MLDKQAGREKGLVYLDNKPLVVQLLEHVPNNLPDGLKRLEIIFCLVVLLPQAPDLLAELLDTEGRGGKEGWVDGKEGEGGLSKLL